MENNLGSSINPTPTAPAPSASQVSSTPVTPEPPAHAPHVKKAHNFLLIYVAILLAAVLAGGVYAWQNSQVKDLNKKLAIAVAQNASLKKQVAAAEASIPSDTNAGNAPNNPYSGWKTFGDNFS